MNAIDATYPSRAVVGLYDRPMWESVQRRSMALQCCEACGTYQYPPGPACTACLSDSLAWRTLSGRGTILSWVVFHKTYLDDYPAPYNVIAVRLEEGPVMVSNLDGPPPEGNWIGTPVLLRYVTTAHRAVLPRFVCATKDLRNAV